MSQKKYFVDLNYSLANEDSKTELDLMPQHAQSVFVIPSSGAQALPLLSRNPKMMDIVDLSPAQLYITELRIQAQKKFSREEWIYFMGYAKDLVDFKFTPVDRVKMFNSLTLSDATKNYWLQSQEFWKDDGFIWLGRWEGFFKRLSDKTRKIFGYEFDRFFEADDLETQREIYHKYWPAKRFRFFLNIVSSKDFMNMFLYNGFFAGAKGKKTKPVSTAQHIDERYREIFLNHLAKENFFMQMLFLGRIKYVKALPTEADPVIYELSKNSETEINYFAGSFDQYLYNKPYDFVHMSDVLSYVSDEDGSALLSRLHPQTREGSRVVARTFLKSPSSWEAPGWTREFALEKEAHKRDTASVYDFLISTKTGFTK